LFAQILRRKTLKLKRTKQPEQVVKLLNFFFWGYAWKKRYPLASSQMSAAACNF
jgi:hypothetical protein